MGTTYNPVRYLRWEPIRTSHGIPRGSMGLSMGFYGFLWNAKTVYFVLLSRFASEHSTTSFQHNNDAQHYVDQRDPMGRTPINSYGIPWDPVAVPWHLTPSHGIHHDIRWDLPRNLPWCPTGTFRPASGGISWDPIWDVIPIRGMVNL